MEVTMEDGEIGESPAPVSEKLERESREAYEVLEQSRSSVEEIVSKMLSIKRGEEQEPEISKSQLRGLITQMFLNFVSLRQANRSILIEEDRVKTETERAKAPVDFTTLQLHNLTYEKNHYLKAIKACKDFKSKYPDIELVPEEEFFRDAPEDIKGSVKSKDSAHDLMLKRLNYELFQRKELCKSHQILEQKKQKLLETIASRKKFLSSLPSYLKSLKKASIPVQNHLGDLHTKMLKQHHSAELLPPPLYVIYSQILAQKEAFAEKIDLDIVGSVKEAQVFARQQAHKDNGTSTNQDNSKLDDDAPEEEDDGQRRRKRPKKVPAKDDHDQSGIYHTHPLKIILHIHDDEASDPKPVKLITLRFEYLFKLNVVCVGIEGSNEGPENSILCNLFPDDTGLELPHQSSKLRVGDAQKFDIKKTLRPYKWAQHLAGIDFLPELSPLLVDCELSGSETSKSGAITSGLSLYRQQNRVQTVVQRIRSRKKAQLALAEQLDILSKHDWPSLSYKSVPWASHTPLCSFHSWSLVGASPTQVLALPLIEAEQVEGSLDMAMDGRSENPKGELENNREDGEVPLLALKSSLNDVKDTPSKGPNLELSKRMPLISKSSPISMTRIKFFKKNNEDSEILVDFDSDLDEPTLIDQEIIKEANIELRGMVKNSWVEYGVRQYCLILTRTMEDNKRILKLEAKIKVSMEYPLRPPNFELNLYTALQGENHSESDVPEWYNVLRAIEAEVNIHILKLMPLDQDKLILAHQVRCLSMLFDYYVEDGDQNLDKINSKPIGSKLLARSYRGRDRRKMISWKDVGFEPDNPC